MLDLAILGLLEERGELHGYEIRKQLRDGLGLLANVSFGSLYPALARLEAAGAVEAIYPGTAAEGLTTLGGSDVPPTGSLSGEWAILRSRRHAGTRSRGRRSKKAYRITDEGRRLLDDLLRRAEGGDDARSFGLRLAFAGHLPPQARLALLERRRVQLAERAVEVRRAGERTRLGAYARSVAEHTADAVDHDIRWLDRLIEAERSAGAPQDPSNPPSPSSLHLAQVPLAVAGGGWPAAPSAAGSPEPGATPADPVPPAPRPSTATTGRPRRGKHPGARRPRAKRQGDTP